MSGSLLKKLGKSALRIIAAPAKKRLDDLLENGKFEEKLVSELERLTGLSSNAPESAE